MAQITDEVIKVIESFKKMDEDLKQDLYLAWLENEEEPEFHSEHHIRAFVAAYYMNLKKNNDKKEGNRRRLIAENHDLIRSMFYEDNQAEDPAEVLDAIETMDERMDSLSPLIRKTMVMHYVDGMTIEDIAGEEWVEPGAIYQRLKHGRDILKGEKQ